jgi:hypothetical protein
MKFNLRKQGIEFDYYGDEVVWVWPWKRASLSRLGSKVVLVSAAAETTFASFRDYWMYWGEHNEVCRKQKVMGFNEDQILDEWVRLKYPHQIVVILRHLSPEYRSGLFWRSIPASERNELTKDISVLFFPGFDQAERVVKSIEPEFAEAYLYFKGNGLFSNLDHVSYED